MRRECQLFVLSGMKAKATHAAGRGNRTALTPNARDDRESNLDETDLLFMVPLLVGILPSFRKAYLRICRT